MSTKRKFVAAVLNNQPDLDGDVYSKEALERLVYNVKPEVPVTHEFLHHMVAGVATNFRLEGEDILCDINFTGWSDDMIEWILENAVPVVGLEGSGGKLNKWHSICEVSLVSPGIAMTPNTWIKEIRDEHNHCKAG